jgi:hypothetical protein
MITLVSYLGMVVVVIHNHSGLGFSQMSLCEGNQFIQMVFIFIYFLNFCMMLFVLSPT